MEWIGPVVFLAAVLALVARGTSWSMRLWGLAFGLALVAIVMMLERSGIWPDAFRR